MIPRIGIGPLSSEIIDSVFRYSQETSRSMMLIASKNQIDYSYGYVNGWNTQRFMDFIGQKYKLYPKADVWVCRDHCGPGFNGEYDLEDTYRTLQEDVENGFNLIHLDFCHLQGSHKDKLKETEKAIKFIRKLNPNIKIEIGTDDNVGELNLDLNRLRSDLAFFYDYNPLFYVAQTGSLIKEDLQIGRLANNLEEISNIIHSFNVNFKEHNSDFLTKVDIGLRKGFIDSMNISPEFGIMQTKLLLNLAKKYELSTDLFLLNAFYSNKWEKWMVSESDWQRKALIAGHYTYTSSSYRALKNKLEAVAPHLFQDSLYLLLKERFDVYHN